MQQPGTGELPRRTQPLRKPTLDWKAAHLRAQDLMQEQASLRGFSVSGESSLAYDPVRGLYRYDVRSSLDVTDRGGSTRLFLDGETGILVATWLPTGAAGGDTFITWMSNLHMASVGGVTYKLTITLAGLVVAMLSLTGVLIWLRKRSARRKSG